jgi:hypothetical protein
MAAVSKVLFMLITPRNVRNVVHTGHLDMPGGQQVG